MICFATNARSSFDNIERWRNEIQTVEDDKPIILIQTKSDLAEIAEEPVDFAEETQKYCSEEGFHGAALTSSKEWEDFNVHKAFDKTLRTAYTFKYGDQWCTI